MRLAVLFVPVLALVGCAAPPEPGPLPTTAAGCEADYFAAQKRIREARRQGNNNGTAGLIGAAFGAGMAESLYNTRYRECMARIGATDAFTAPLPTSRTRSSAPVRNTAPSATTGGYCPPDASVMQGGVTYCVGDN